jgi:uncharacterized membrane protein YeaQ/YmgE (transglycosylase-associated protein family)
MIFGVFGWILLGMLLAITVRVVLRIKDPDGMPVTVLLAVAGALLGGFLSVALEFAEVGGRTGLIAALLGSIVALGLKTWAVQHENRPI